MAPKAYKVVNTHSHVISVLKFICIIIHAHAPHLGEMNGDVQSDLITLVFKNGKQFEYFHSRIIRLQKEIILSGKTISTTRLLFQYTKAFSKSDKIIAFITPNMTYLITFLENNRKSDVYTRENINGIYCYLEIIGAPNTLTASGQRSHNFGT